MSGDLGETISVNIREEDVETRAIRALGAGQSSHAVPGHRKESRELRVRVLGTVSAQVEAKGPDLSAVKRHTEKAESTGASVVFQT